MSDEQMIYISPDDDLTSVRERLEGVLSKQVTLIIPPHTQLRSHVAWKLLHARAREMGKEVLIISSDPQIRSVAQAVKFRVANSLEASQSGQVRSGSSRSGRVSSAGKAKSSSLSSQRSAPGKEAEGRGTDSPRSRMQRQTSRKSPDAAERTGEKSGGKRPGTGETVTGKVSNVIPPAFRVPDKQYGQPYDFRIDTAPPIHPLPPEPIEEPDLFLEDYHQSQDIRKAASGEIPRQRLQEAADKTPRPPEEVAPEDESLLAHRHTPLPRIQDDPYEFMQDSQPPPPSEQRAAVSMEDLDAGKQAIRDISEPPIEMVEGEIEYQGDMGDFVIHSDDSDVPPAVRPSQARDLRRPGRMGTASKELRLPQEPEREEDALPPTPIADVPTRVIRPSQPLSQSRLRSGPIRSAPSAPRQAPGASTGARSTRSQPLARPAMSSTSAGRPRVGPQTRAQKAPRQRMSASNALLIASVIAVLAVVGLLAYFGPSASVSITLPSRDYFHAVHLVARPNVAANPGLAVVPAQTQVKTFTVSGTGTATGKTKVGTVPATGTVFFTNNGTAPVEIPTGSVVATGDANAVMFVTTADAVISPASANSSPPPIPVPVQAQKAGESGNVAAGSITVIPDDSLNTIAQFNKVQPANLKLKVVNDKDITGGGTGTAIVVQRQDLDGVKKSLHAQAQGDIDAWLKQLSANGVMGKTSITDTLVNPPGEGQVVNNGSFPAVLKIDVAALYLPATSLQSATLAQLNRFIAKDGAYPNYVVVADAKHPVRIDGLRQTAGDLAGMTLDFTATARATPNITADTVRRMIAGTSIGDAQTLLASRVPGVQKQNVEIKVSPGFISWVPFFPERIDVTFVPGAAPPTKQKP